MNDEQKREHAEAIKHALGMGYGPPMEGEEGWVDPRQKALDRMAENARELGLTYDPADDPLVAMYVEGDAIDRWLVPDDRRLPQFVVPANPPSFPINIPAQQESGTVRVNVHIDSAADPQVVIEQIRQDKERRMADELAEERAKAAEPNPAPPSNDPWAVIGKAEDDGEDIMRETRRFC